MAKNIYVADFETTVYDNQKETEVWLGGIAKVGANTPEEVQTFNSIDGFFSLLKKKEFTSKRHVVIYFHNLKFDGSFILTWLLKNKTMAYDHKIKKFKKTKDLYSGEFTTLVSSKGQWYSIIYKYGNTVFEILDSLKILPLSVKEIGDSFQTKRRKLDMNYKGVRYANCPVKPEEYEYLKNDVLVVSEAIKQFIDLGHEKSTIGSNCLEEYMNLLGGKDVFYHMFPQLQDIVIPTGEICDEYVRKSYKGGWCYLLRPGYHKKGLTLDVNSLYPFVMKKFKIPYGTPTYHDGTEEMHFNSNTYKFIRIKCNFELKEGYLPTIQIKNNPLYKGNEWLKTTYIYSGGYKYKKWTVGVRNPKEYDTRQEITLCETDYLLLKRHYNLYDFEIVDWIEFPAEKGLFDVYMNKYFKLKEGSEGGMKKIAKLFLNNLYGKLGTSPDSSFKVPYIDDVGCLHFIPVKEKEKDTYHVASASAITGWARFYEITHAQKNYDRFVYADTDSLHLADTDLSQLKGFDIDKKKIGAWDCEAEWSEGVFVRQKTYIERCGNDVNVTACGMGKKCKEYIKYAILKQEGKLMDEEVNMMYEGDEHGKHFVSKGLKIKHFNPGLIVPGNLKGRSIPGGTLLVEQDFTMH